jgi:adenine/guanine phosphoribosyltransferase-like PRPP-binding protein
MSHYSFGQKPFMLMPWSQKMAKEIHTTFKDGGVMPVLLYSGMSGIALSTAVANSFYSMYGQNLYMTYIRKEGERSHGSNVEWEYLYDKDILHEDYVSFFCLPDKSKTGKIPICLIFVDDFVSSGQTLIRCINKFRGAIANRSDVILQTKKVLFCSGREEVLTDYSEIQMMESKYPITKLLESGRDADEEKFVQENMPPATPVEKNPNE